MHMDREFFCRPVMGSSAFSVGDPFRGNNNGWVQL